MAYAIEPKSTKDFIAMETNLPRFQRKQTWKPISNFKLCISLFKKYPIGVVIINKNKNGNWLLDGRQRLNALKQISSNPEEVYKWAMRFVKFKANSQPEEITDKYWRAIDEYLQKNYEEDIYHEGQKEENDTIIEPEELESEEINERIEESNFEERAFNPAEQTEALKILLELILMVHNFKNKKSKWERIFDFNKIRKESDRQLSYYKEENGQLVFHPEELIHVMNEILKSEKNYTGEDKRKKAIISHYKDVYWFRPEDENQVNALRKILEEKWDDINRSFEVISGVNKVLEDARIGIIEITSASDLDAQNIFSLVNSGGTQLTAEELLSAKPYWNVKINNPSLEAKRIIDELYEKLEVINSGDVVRWDLCATLISRIDENCIIFEKKDDKESLASQTTLGFKLFAALYIGGINNTSVSDIENKNPIEWNTQFEDLVRDLNILCDILERHAYFGFMKRWHQSISSLTSTTIALEFITIIYNEWKKIGKIVVDSSELNGLKRNAVALLDRLIYEYSTKQWRGSSDSKLAADIMNSSSRMIAKTNEEWEALLRQMSNGRVNDQVVTQNLVKPILFHEKFIAQIPPTVSDLNSQYDLDHIYPKSQFNNNRAIQEELKDSLCNLQILSSQANKQKNDKKLNEIKDNLIIDEIAKSSGIKEDQFEQYSTIANLQKMIEERLERIIRNYTEKRSETLSD